MRKLLILMAGLGLVVANSASADFVGARLSGGVFKYSVSGSIGDGGANIDVKNELGWKDDNATMGYLYIEHPIPVLPNIRLGTTSLEFTGTGTISSGTTFNGQPVSGSVTSKLDLSHTEIGLYYEVIDVGFDLDLGLNFKMFDGKATLNSAGGNASSTYKATIPMLYGSLRVPIPGTGFSVAGDLSTVSYKDSKITDYLVRVRYDTDFMLGVELGYRSLNIDYKDGSQVAKVDTKGPYLSATLTF